MMDIHLKTINVRQTHAQDKTAINVQQVILHLMEVQVVLNVTV